MFYNLLSLICFWVKELGVLTAEMFLCLWGNTFDRNSSPNWFWLLLNHISGVSFLLICDFHNSSMPLWCVIKPLHDKSWTVSPLARWHFGWAQGRIGSNISRTCHGLSLIKTIDLEVNEPSSLDLLLKFYLYIKGSCCSHSYLLCTCSVCHWSLLLPLTLIFPLFQCFLLHSLPRSWFSLLSSLLAVFVSQNVQDRHNRRGYNVENLEISIVVFFSF